MPHPALAPNNVAVITGGASGIGLAAAMRFAQLGLKVCIADVGADKLSQAAAALAEAAPEGAASVMTAVTDVSSLDEVTRLETAVRERFGGTDVLMNNAGIQPGSRMFGPAENWQRILGVNLWGVIHGSQVFAPGMIARGRPGLIINTGSKQGITTPPGDPAYNVSKAGVKAFTEALQHELRNAAGSRLSAHLLIPGFVFTGLTARGRSEKPAAAWTPEQTIDFMIERLSAGDFYILCPDNDVPRSSTSGGSSGPRGISSKTGPRCRGGIRISRRRLRRLWKGNRGWPANGAEQPTRLYAASISAAHPPRAIWRGVPIRRAGTCSTTRKCSVTVMRSTSGTSSTRLISSAGTGASSSIASGTSGGESVVSGNTPNSPATSRSGFCLSAQCSAV